MRKYLLIILLFFIPATVFVSSCDKGDMFSDEYFSLKINSVVGEYEPQTVVVKNGITVIAAKTEAENRSESVVITINGDKPGSYKQVFDYKTGVSVKSCGLTYKISAKNHSDNTPSYYTSYEGELIISEMDKSDHLISGSYRFFTRALDNDTTIHEITGEFLNIPYH